MNNLFTKRLSFIYVLLATLAFSSCEKMAGHSIVPAAVTPTTVSTFTYQVGTAAAVTYSSPTYNMSFALASANGGPESTNINVFNTSGNSIFLSFTGKTPGTYTVQAAAIETSALSLKSSGAQTIIISTESYDANLSGTIKGSFDGIMTDKAGNNPVRVTGSFNITQ